MVKDGHPKKSTGKEYIFIIVEANSNLG